VNIILVLFVIVFSAIGIYLYYKGNKNFLSGDFKTYALFMLYGIIIYTIHLFFHLFEESIEIGWLSETFENFTSLGLHIFLAIIGLTFLIGGYFYLRLSQQYGFKKK